MESIYRRFELPVSEAFDAFLDTESEKAKNFVSGHDYDPEGQGPARARLYEELGHMYKDFGWEA